MLKTSEDLLKEVVGNKTKIWTWRNAATHFTRKGAEAARKGEKYYVLGQYLFAAEECLKQIEMIRQARDSKICL